MRYSSRFFLYAPIALLVLFAATVSAWWKVAAGSFDARLGAANGHEIMPGVRLSYASKSMSGFPFNLDTMLDGFALQIQMRTGPFTWRADHFVAHRLTYGEDQQIFEAAGTQTLSWTDSRGVQHRFSFVPGSLRASAIVSAGRLTRFDLDLVALNSSDLSADRLQFHIRRSPDKDALDFIVSGDGIHLAPDLRAGIGDEIKELNIDGSLTPASPLQVLLAGQSDWRAAAEAWRIRSGAFAVRPFEIVWKTMTATASGELSLDASHRLQGSFDLGIAGQWRLMNEWDEDAKLVSALDRVALALARDTERRLNFSIDLWNGDVSVGPRKLKNIVIAVDRDGNVTRNGESVALGDLKTRFKATLKNAVPAGTLEPLY